jgi:heptosyltransferase-1
MTGPRRILMVRLGAMGDVIHCLPAAASLKQGIGRAHLTWVIESRWAPLLRGNPHVDEVIALDRRSFGGVAAAWKQIRSRTYETAVDFQGLMKSALVASMARPGRLFGFSRRIVREKPAAWFYSDAVDSVAQRVVDQYLELAIAAGASAIFREFPLPRGHPEGELPGDPFVLASPLAGWPGKQWPLEFYGALGERLWKECGLRLVLNGASRISVPGTTSHVSSLDGLIDATRRAVAVVGVDSGPMHLASALGKPGIAIFGPTDPLRNGPCGGALRVLRSAAASTTYKRNVSDSAMREVGPDAAMEALRGVIEDARAAAMPRT